MTGSSWIWGLSGRPVLHSGSVRQDLRSGEGRSGIRGQAGTVSVGMRKSGFSDGEHRLFQVTPPPEDLQRILQEDCEDTALYRLRRAAAGRSGIGQHQQGVSDEKTIKGR